MIPKEKEESPHSQTKKEKFQKTWYPPARPRGRIQAKVERKTREKVVRKEKNNGDKNGGEAKKGQM